eukprot:COSAG02_NODE_3727_length_6315_cov_20.568694_6_plen_69_part_00
MKTPCGNELGQEIAAPGVLSLGVDLGWQDTAVSIESIGATAKVAVVLVRIRTTAWRFVQIVESPEENK